MLIQDLNNGLYSCKRDLTKTEIFNQPQAVYLKSKVQFIILNGLNPIILSGFSGKICQDFNFDSVKNKIDKGFQDGFLVLQNVALNKLTKSSAVMNDKLASRNYASRVVDGSYTENYHSVSEDRVWLMIDLESIYFVKEIRFYGRAAWRSRRGFLKVNFGFDYSVFYSLYTFFVGLLV